MKNLLNFIVLWHITEKMNVQKIEALRKELEQHNHNYYISTTLF